MKLGNHQKSMKMLISDEKLKCQQKLQVFYFFFSFGREKLKKLSFLVLSHAFDTKPEFFSLFIRFWAQNLQNSKFFLVFVGFETKKTKKPNGFVRVLDKN